MTNPNPKPITAKISKLGIKTNTNPINTNT